MCEQMRAFGLGQGVCIAGGVSPSLQQHEAWVASYAPSVTIQTAAYGVIPSLKATQW